MKIYSFVILFAMLFSSIAISACEGDDDNPSEFQACDYNPYMPGDIIEHKLPNGQIIRTELLLEEYEGKQYLSFQAGAGQPKAYAGCEGNSVVQIVLSNPTTGTSSATKTKQLEFPIELGRKWELSPKSRIYSEVDQSEIVTLQQAEISSLSKSVTSFGVTYDAIETKETTTFIYLYQGDTIHETSSYNLRFWVAGEGLVLSDTQSGKIEQRRVAQ
jgi:hypothetical protein